MIQYVTVLSQVFLSFKTNRARFFAAFNRFCCDSADHLIDLYYIQVKSRTRGNYVFVITTNTIISQRHAPVVMIVINCNEGSNPYMYYTILLLSCWVLSKPSWFCKTGPLGLGFEKLTISARFVIFLLKPS